MAGHALSRASLLAGPRHDRPALGGPDPSRQGGEGGARPQHRAATSFILHESECANEVRRSYDGPAWISASEGHRVHPDWVVPPDRGAGRGSVKEDFDVGIVMYVFDERYPIRDIKPGL